MEKPRPKRGPFAVSEWSNFRGYVFGDDAIADWWFEGESPAEALERITAPDDGRRLGVNTAESLLGVLATGLVSPGGRYEGESPFPVQSAMDPEPDRERVQRELLLILESELADTDLYGANREWLEAVAQVAEHHGVPLPPPEALSPSRER